MPGVRRISPLYVGDEGSRNQKQGPAQESEKFRMIGFFIFDKGSGGRNPAQYAVKKETTGSENAECSQAQELATHESLEFIETRSSENGIEQWQCT